MTFFNGTITGATYTISYTINSNFICDSKYPLIELASNVLLIGFIGTLNFQIFKYCRNEAQPIPIGPELNFSRTVSTSESAIVSFFVSDEYACLYGPCCTYKLNVTFVAGDIPLPPT